jgi:hypothetical protein
MAGENESLRSTLTELGMQLKNSSLLMKNPSELLGDVLREFFHDHGGFVDMCVKHLPSPLENASRLVKAIIILEALIQPILSIDPSYLSWTIDECSWSVVVGL